MTTTAEKILYLNETKIAIKDAIVAKGVEVADDASFRSYAERIAEIETKTPLQEKTMDITENGSYEATPDEGYALGKVTANVEIVPVIEALEVTENGTYEVAEGIDGYGPVVVNVPTGGGDVEPIVMSGNCSYSGAGALASQYIKMFGNTISTSNITDTSYMFSGSDSLKVIPFEINGRVGSNISMQNMFGGCYSLTSVPKMNNIRPLSMQYMFSHCHSLRELPEDIETWFDWNYLDTCTSTYSGQQNALFSNCWSLRRVPINFLAHGNPNVYDSYSIYTALFGCCYTLDEIIGLPNPHKNVTWTSSVLHGIVSDCYRLKNFTFAMPDGMPYVVKWKSQTLDLSGYVGYCQSAFSDRITDYNSGITSDKRVKDDATYQALKDDPDWWTALSAYSRYNHDSAVATINSLPDTSAYLATAGGTNTIKFKGTAGSATDGGAINTLTEEEIAVATAKGWTVTFVS